MRRTEEVVVFSDWVMTTGKRLTFLTSYSSEVEKDVEVKVDFRLRPVGPSSLWFTREVRPSETDTVTDPDGDKVVT